MEPLKTTPWDTAEYTDVSCASDVWLGLLLKFAQERADFVDRLHN